MRLLKWDEDGSFSLTSNLVDSDIPDYAILSHTWASDDEEVTFNDLQSGSNKSKAGYAKMEFCARQARKDALQYFWIDTCCINKADLSELSEAIVSMYRWYKNAIKCYVYLADVEAVDADHCAKDNSVWLEAFEGCRWFTRGWTLQELLAPPSVEFYSKEGIKLGDKIELSNQIQNATGIPINALKGAPLSSFSIDEKIRWAEDRHTKRKEDRAYCLMGVFDIYIPLIYGEGDQAYTRLHEAIQRAERNRERKENDTRFADSFITILDLSVDAKIRFCSDYIQEILGYSPQEVAGRSCWAYIHFNEIRLAQDIYRRAIDLEEAAVYHHLQLKHKGNSWVHCECIFSVLQDALIATISRPARGAEARRRALRCADVQQIFKPQSRDARPRWTYLSGRPSNIEHKDWEPRAALLLNRFTRTCTVMFASSGVSAVLGLLPDQIMGRSFYYLISEECLRDVINGLESAKASDYGAILYLSFVHRNSTETESSRSSSPTNGSMEGKGDEEGASSGERVANMTGRSKKRTFDSLAQDESRVELGAAITCTADGIVVILRRA